MGKNDDFAARLARIKEQSNAPDPTGGTTTDPRSARAPAWRSSALQDTAGTLFSPRLVLGGLAALALSAYMLTPPSAEDVAAAQAKAETKAKYSLFRASPDSRVVYSGEKADAPLTNDENPYVQKIRANRDRNMTETDHRVALITARNATDKATAFEMPNNLRPFLNEDGTLTKVTQDLVTQVESE